MPAAVGRLADMNYRGYALCAHLLLACERVAGFSWASLGSRYGGRFSGDRQGFMYLRVMISRLSRRVVGMHCFWDA